MNFLEDLALLTASDLMSRRIPFRKKWLTEPIFFYAGYLEFLRRHIHPRPRRVLVSDTLRGGEEWSAYRERLDELTNASERGDDLSHYQTKDVDAFGTPDLLLSDWGIHHLHLGTQRIRRKHSRRTEDLLFVLLLEPSELCFIDIGDHSSFADVELLEIVKRNWPHALAGSLVPGASNLQPKRDAQGLEALRRAGITTLVPLSSGEIIVPPGLGLTTARSSVKCMMQAQEAARDLSRAQEYVERNLDSLRIRLAMDSGEEIHLLGYRYEFVVVGPRDGRATVSIPFIRPGSGRG